MVVGRWEGAEGLSQRESRVKIKIPEARKSLARMKPVCRAQKTEASMARWRGGATRSSKDSDGVCHRQLCLVERGVQLQFGEQTRVNKNENYGDWVPTMGPGEKRDTQEWYKLGKESDKFEYGGHEIIAKEREGMS